MSPIKDLQVVYDSLNEKETFSAGDVVTGTVSFNLTEDTEVKGLIVKVKGDAHVCWTEGTGDRRRTHHAYRRYFKVKEFLIAETGTALPRGVHRFKFRLQIPQGNFPPSFKGLHGRIAYVLQAKMSRSWRWPASVHKELKFVSKYTSQKVMCPQTASVSKEIGHFSKGKIEMSATINMKVCSPGDTIDVVAKIHNSSSKKVKPKVSLMQQVVYCATGHRRTSGQCLWKYAGDSLENKEGTISCQVKIPDDAMCTVADCDIISVTNILKVYVDVSFSFDPEVVFPLDIVPSSCGTFQPGVAPGPYPAAAGGPSYSDFPPPAFPVGPYPGPAPIGPGAYGYPPAGPTQPANMTSGYNNPWQPQAVPYGFPAAAPSAVQHPAPTAPPLSQQGEQPPPYMSLYPHIQPTFSGTGPDHKY
ncbi:arrestin domain-containing protein 3-like [Epinephelus moara]|uniref:arrestin domain-containing protein 3-like n=1 Tax=Epinephelus moara TaxID=300413 RepID=UPI00214E05CF|nr:arrestin domain-containing protein 3-like [Epinephelus moara]